MENRVFNRPTTRLKGSTGNKIKTEDIVKARQNTNNRGFDKRLEIGIAGECIVKEFLLKNGYNYIDCTRNSKMLTEAEIAAYEKAEIDLIVESKKDNIDKSVEVKTFSKNIEDSDYLCVKVSTQYIDEEQQIQRQDDAYLYRTKASNIFFVSLNSRHIYNIETEVLRQYIEENKDVEDNVFYKTYLDNKDKNDKYDRYNKCAYVNKKDLLNKGLLIHLTKNINN